jgi:predicted small lipoprotein YifL
MRKVLTPALFVLVIAALAACASSPPVQLSSLGREVDVRPLRGQPVELLKQDDAACESWTRSTKGPNEPLPAAELRYSACALSRGYSVKPWDHRISPPASPAPDLAGVVADLQACGLKRGLYDPAGLVLLGAVEAGMTEARRAAVWGCLEQRGYAVKYQPDPRAESIRKK